MGRKFKFKFLKPAAYSRNSEFQTREFRRAASVHIAAVDDLEPQRRQPAKSGFSRLHFNFATNGHKTAREISLDEISLD